MRNKATPLFLTAAGLVVVDQITQVPHPGPGSPWANKSVT